MRRSGYWRAVADDVGSLRYQPALDGVRAAAVVAVLIFHSAPGVLRGGFLGVDAFFVLSGFLITTLLLAERERRGTIRLAAFWGRRARRLLPALILVVAAVAVAAPVMVPPEEFANLRGDAVAALGYVANWHMIYRGGDYFAQTATASPLQHTWSLGIEEQFYLVWPVVVMLAALTRRPRLAIVTVAGSWAGASAIAAALLYRADSIDRVYYGTDTRAAALLIGCAVAAALPALGRLLAPGLVAVPVVAVLAWAWTHADGDAAWLYRGGLPGLAVAVAVLLGHLVAAPASVPARVLAIAPLAALGRISYGVYLWHWPLYGLLTGGRTGLTGPPLLALRVAVTLVVAVASYRLVERPLRRLNRSSLRVAVPAGAFAVACAVALTLAVPAAVVARGRFTGSPVAWHAALVEPPPTGGGQSGGASREARPSPRAGRSPGEPRVMIIGDSVAWSLAEYLPPHPGIGITNRGIQGCGIARLPDIRYVGEPHTNYPGCDRWDGRWRGSVDSDDPDWVVVLLARWELMDRRLNGRYQHVGDPEFDEYLRGELRLALSIAEGRGARVAVLTAPYNRRAERPDGGLYPEDTPERTNAWNALVGGVVAADPTRPVVLDLQRVVCPDGRFTWSVDGVRVRSDGLHFTPAGVRQVVAPWLLGELRRLAAA